MDVTRYLPFLITKGNPLPLYAFLSVVVIYLFYRFLASPRLPPINIKKLPPQRWTPQKVLTKKTGKAYLITGGSGFLGSHLVEGLLARGESNIVIYDLSEPTLFSAEVAAGKVKWIKGNINDKPTLVKACQGIAVVFHCAASVDFWSRLPWQLSAIWAINVAGTESVIEASKQSAVTQIVFVSSSTVRVDGSVMLGVDEESVEKSFTRHVNHYGLTKAEAEKRILAANGTKNANNETIHTIALRPHGLYGPRDLLMLGSYYDNCVALSYTNQRQDFIYVENLVHGLFCAENATNPTQSKEALAKAAGQAYFIVSDSPIGYSDFVHAIAAEFGRPVFVLYHIATVLAYSSEFITKISRGMIPTGELRILTPPALILSRAEYFFNDSKARRLLGYRPPYTIREGVKLGCQYFINREKTAREEMKNNKAK